MKTLRDHKLRNISDFEEKTKNVSDIDVRSAENLDVSDFRPVENPTLCNKQIFLKAIKEMRDKVNSNLDELERQYLQELEEKSKECECKLHEEDAMSIHQQRSLGDIVAQSDLRFIQIKSLADVSYVNVYLGNSRCTAPITGCTMSRDRRLFVADYYGSGKMTSYDKEGTFLRFMSISDPPYDVAMIDANRVVVTYGDKCYLEILNTETNNVEKKVQFEGQCWGVSYFKDRIYVCVGEGEIGVVDLAGNVVSTIKIEPKSVKYVTVSSGRIYLADKLNNTLHCIDMEGNPIWMSEQVGKLGGISVDKKGNVFVVDSVGNKLLIVHHDGKECKTLLSVDRNEPLSGPSAVYCNTNIDSGTICMGFTPGCVAIYSLL